MEERHVGLLKRQLQVLNYQECFDPSSYNLVKKLVADLIHTTETYQSLKQQSSEQLQEIASFRSKIDAIKKDSSRVVRANNTLHAQLIQRDEESDAQQAEQYQRVKELESEIAELSFWKHQASARMEQAEKSKCELKERLADLMKLDGGHLISGQDEIARDIEILRAVEQRLAQVQQEVKNKETQLSQVTGEMKLLQLSLQHRDGEIQRLSAKLETDREADMSTLSLRNETNEAIILSLNQQVDVLTSQVAALEDETKDAEYLKSNLHKAQAEKLEADKKLFAAITENASIQQQVSHLQQEVSRIKADTAKKPKPGLEDRNVLEHVTNLQSALDKANASQEQHKHRTVHREKQREASQRREAQLRSKVDALKTKLEKAEKSVLFHERKVEELRKTLAATKQREEKSNTKTMNLQASLTDMTEQFEDLRRMLKDEADKMKTCDADRQAQEMEVQQLRSADAAASQERILQQSTLDELTAEKQRLEAQVTSLNKDRTSLQEQLQETVKLKTSAITGGERLQGDHDKLFKEVDGLQQRLTAANVKLDSAISERDQFEIQANKSDRELKLIQEECIVLQADVCQSRQQWQEHRERLSATEGELGHLSGLRNRSEALEAELKSTLSRVATTDFECSRLRSDVERWRKAAGDDEDKALSAQAALRDAERRHGDCQQDLSRALSDCDTMKVKMKSCDSSVSALTEEVERSKAALQLGEQRLQNERKKVQDLEYKLQSMQHAIGNDRQLLLSKEEELTRQKAQLDTCQQTIQMWQGKHRDAMAELAVAADRSRQHAVLLEGHKKDLETTRLQLEDEKSKHAEQQNQASNTQGELAAAQSDVEQLKSLVLASNRTQVDLESQLSSQGCELRAARTNLEEATGGIKQKQEEVDKAYQNLAQAQSVVRQLDLARDRLQAQLDDQAETVEQLESQKNQMRSDIDELDVNRRNMEQRLVQADRQISHLQNECQCAEQRELLCKQNLLALQQEYERLQEETAALSEDLAVMVKENQMITSQLGDATQRMEDSRKASNAAHASAAILQQTVKARELELHDMRVAYEGLAAESRHHEATISQLKRQLAGSATELEGAKAEILHVRDAAQSSQQQIQQYVVDVQALERNSDALARELQGSKREAEELAQDRNRVLEQIQMIQGMRYEAERSRDNLQQEVARLDSQLHISNARLDEAHSEIRKCTSNNAILHSRINEFEKLTETMREKEFSMSQLMLQHSDDGSDPAKEKCKRLQLQVHSMEQELRAANEHITRLHTEVSKSNLPLQIADEPNADQWIRLQACQAELEEAQKEAAEASCQELAIVRRQLETARSSTSRVAHPSSNNESDPDKDQTIPNLQQKANDLQVANAELQNRANSLKGDKERLLRMVSRLELERHHLQSLKTKRPAATSESAGSALNVSLDGHFDGCATGQMLPASQTERNNLDNLYIGTLTDLIEMNDRFT